MRAVDYPGSAADTAGVLTVDGGWSPLTGDAPARLLSGRTCVVAVGSNASPPALHAKLAAADVRTEVAMVPYELDGLAVAHSAHVSRGGYVPTAPFPSPGARSRVVASWLDGAALAAVDATEPSYARRVLPDSVRGAPPGAQAYWSRWGLLAPAGTPLAATTQVAVHEALRTDPELAALLPSHDPAAVVRVLADGRVARAVRARVVALCWVLPAAW